MGAELHFMIDDALTKGIKPYEFSRVNSEYMSAVSNVEPSPVGLVEPDTFTLPMSSFPESYSYPFPQLFFGKNTTLLVYAASVYEVTTTGSPGLWTTTKLTVWDALDPETEKVFNAGTDLWHFVDLEDYWYLICPYAIVFKSHKDGMFVGGSDKVYAITSSNLSVNTGTYHRGRILIAGFEADKTWFLTPWSELWNHWLTQIAVNFEYDIDVDAPDGRYVMWSSIGGGDFPLALIDPEWVSTPGPIDTTLGHSVSEPYMFQQLRRGELGWMPMPFQGEVYGLLPLGRDVIAYCENGIARLTMRNDAPVPTYGLEVLSDVGVVDRGSFAGDESEHMFLLNDGEVCKVTPQAGISPLGYIEQFEDHLAYPHTMSLLKRKGKRKFYIATEYYTYAFNKNGMFKMLISPGLTSCCFTQGVPVGVYAQAGEGLVAPSSIVSVVTEPFDMNYRGEKILTRVEISFEAAADTGSYINPDLIVYYKSTARSTSWGNQTFDVEETEGCYSDIRLGGTEFYLALQWSSNDDESLLPYTDLKINWIKVWYQITDRRWYRGI